MPGPQGATGAAGTNGTDGVDAFTLLAGGFTMPAELASVVTSVDDNTWIGLNQILYIQSAGYMQATAINVNGTGITLKNLEDTANGAYPDNAAPGVAIPNQSKVSPGGVQGPAGVNPATALLSANNLSDVASAAASRTNLGLGTMATQNAAAVAITGGSVAGITDLAVADGGTGASTAAGARTNLGLGTIATQNAAAVAITGGSIVGITDLAVADGGTGASTATAARANLGVLSGYGLLASKDAVDLNVATSDNAVTVASTRYRIDKVTVESPSAAVVAATLGLFTAAGGGGTTLCADQALAATLTGTTKFMDLVKAAVVGTDEFTSGTLYIRVGTAEGAARTANVRIYGWAFDLT